jgi:hypothetical protein
MKLKMFIRPETKDFFLHIGKTKAENYTKYNGLFYFDSEENEYCLGVNCNKKRLTKILGNIYED